MTLAATIVNQDTGKAFDVELSGNLAELEIEPEYAQQRVRAAIPGDVTYWDAYKTSTGLWLSSSEL